MKFFKKAKETSFEVNKIREISAAELKVISGGTLEDGGPWCGTKPPQPPVAGHPATVGPPPKI